MTPVEKTILYITGLSCAGKSTMLNKVAEEYSESYLVSYDKLKWHLSGYHRDKHKPLIKRLTFSLLEAVCAEGLFVLLDLYRPSKNEFDQLEEIARRHGYTLKTVFMTANEAILIERFRQRIKKIKAAGSRASVMDESLYRENLAKQYYLPPETIKIDTSKNSESETFQEIMQTLFL
jgi:adenylylsulfate kinase-like enzyme